jgi:hypothetical protein
MISPPEKGGPGGILDLAMLLKKTNAFSNGVADSG